jgi:hypothetical protein
MTTDARIRAVCREEIRRFGEALIDEEGGMSTLIDLRDVRNGLRALDTPAPAAASPDRYTTTLPNPFLDELRDAVEDWRNYGPGIPTQRMGPVGDRMATAAERLMETIEGTTPPAKGEMETECQPKSGSRLPLEEPSATSLADGSRAATATRPSATDPTNPRPDAAEALTEAVEAFDDRYRYIRNGDRWKAVQAAALALVSEARRSAYDAQAVRGLLSRISVAAGFVPGFTDLEAGVGGLLHRALSAEASRDAAVLLLERWDRAHAIDTDPQCGFAPEWPAGNTRAFLRANPDPEGKK